jgi:hypothetical protein
MTWTGSVAPARPPLTMTFPTNDRPDKDWEITLDAKRGFRSLRTYRAMRLGWKSAAWIMLGLVAGTWGGIFLLGYWTGLCHG